MLFGAEKLSILLPVCLLNDPSLYICFFILLGLHQEDHGIRELINLESNGQNPCLHCFNSLYFHINVVSWWPYCLPSVSHLHKSGKRIILLFSGPFHGEFHSITESKSLFFTNGAPCLCRLLMRISDIAMIGGKIPFIKEWWRT